jgi:hypothetical protein
MPTTEEVPQEPRSEPNLPEITAILKPGGALEEAERKQADGTAATGKIYQQIEKNHRGNRKAVSIIRWMMKQSADKRNDCIRTLEPLLVHYRYTLDDIDPQDLVGMSEHAPASDAVDGDDGEPVRAEGMTDEEWEASKPADGGNASASALDEARGRLNGDGPEPGSEVDVAPAAAAKKGRGKLHLATPAGNA